LVLSNILTFAVVVAVCFALTFVSDLVAKVRERWPGIFETDNPIPEEMPESWMAFFLVAVLLICVVGVKYGVGSAVLALYGALALAVFLIHGVPYIRHQYRRVRSH
jgi:hypothetical protein